jgi:sodium/potassium-transporting ATPase subunit alpha
VLITGLPIAEVLASLKTSASGLDDAAALARLREFGLNRIELILWVAAALAFFAETRGPGTGMWQVGAAILAVILVNGIFSFLQEYRAEVLRKGFDHHRS